MRKQARRLWLGEWQPEEPPSPQPVADDSEHADTVVITPVDDEGAEPPAQQRRNVPRGAAIGAAIAALFGLLFAVSSGHQNVQLTSPPAQIPQAQPPAPQTQIPPGAPQSGFGGPDLTGPAAVKAAEAATAKYPGSVERVTQGPTGSDYVVHVFQADGYEVHVLVGGDFQVEGSDAGSGPPPTFGPGTSQ